MTHNTSPTAPALDPAPAAERPDPGTPRRRVRIGSPLSLLAAIPGLTRFQPEHSIVVLGTGHPRAEVDRKSVV